MIKNPFNAAVSFAKTAYNELANKVGPANATLIVGLPVYMAFTMATVMSGPLNHYDTMQVGFNMAVKGQKPIWTTTLIPYLGDAFCTDNAVSYATNQVSKNYTLPELKTLTHDDVVKKIATIAQQELARLPACKNTVIDYPGLLFHFSQPEVF